MADRQHAEPAPPTDAFTPGECIQPSQPLPPPPPPPPPTPHGAANADLGVKKTRKRYTICNQRQAWTPDEHSRFLTGLMEWGRDWRRIADFVGSKTVVQTRSHAQKHFLRLKKTDTRNCLPTSAGDAPVGVPPPAHSPVSSACPPAVEVSLPPNSPFSSQAKDPWRLGVSMRPAAVSDDSTHAKSENVRISAEDVDFLGCQEDALPRTMLSEPPLELWPAAESKVEASPFNDFSDEALFGNFCGTGPNSYDFRSFSL